MDTEPRPLGVAEQPVAVLMAMAADGDNAAAAELDRRGVEPEMVEPGPAPIASFDLTREHEPNPAWLREYAGAMKLEAVVLEGHVETLGMRGDSPTLRLAMRATAALAAAHNALTALAAELDAVAEDASQRQGD